MLEAFAGTLFASGDANHFVAPPRGWQLSGGGFASRNRVRVQASNFLLHGETQR
jgi:hypothetical protein